MYKLILFSALSLFLTSASASATTVNVDFKTDGVISDGDYNFGEELIIRSQNPPSAVTRSIDGLGVGNGYLDGPNEALIFYFAEEVFNLKLTFAEWDHGKDLIYITTAIVNPALQRCFKDCGPIRLEVDENGEFQFLKSVTTLYVNVFGDGDETFTSLATASWDTELSAVPLPAALPLYAAGMGLLGFLGWRKKRKNL